jgi:mono/diheme cytochrome c family protein
MVDIEYHFANLWFAANREQWDLAAFYLRETRSHLDWAVRMRPVRQVQGGGTVDLKAFQSSILTGFASVATTIEQKDKDAFADAYRQTMTQCHACHEASGLGYLDPHIPVTAPSSMMIRE